MKFFRTFEYLTSIVALLGFIALILPGDLEVLWLILIALTWLGSLGHWRFLAPSEPLWRVITAVFLFYAFGLYLFSDISALTVARQLLIYLQINRLYVRKTNRDYAFVYLLAFLQILLGCLLTISPAFALLLVLFLMCGGWALMLLQLKAGMDRQAKADGEQEATPVYFESDVRRYRPGEVLLKSRFLASSVVLVLLMLVLSVLMFLFVPRMQMGFLRAGGGSAVHVAGFSDSVKLGEVGEILQGRGRVMRVRVDGDIGLLPKDPYWRGIALDNFDGITWRQAGTYADYYRTLPMRYMADKTPYDSNIVQHYTLENIDSIVLFAIPDVRAMQTSLGTVLRDYSGSFATEEKQSRMDYVVYSRFRVPNPLVLDAETHVLPKRLEKIYLQLPELAPEVKALAEKITENTTGSFQRVKKIEQYLRSEYEYTLEPKSEGKSPLVDFLFVKKAGHCEYFASAMVMLTRSLGIPSRLINGFMGGELNPVGGYYVVRQSDAHSWVEVWFEKSGWVRFDPTPAGAQSAAASRSDTLLEKLSHYVDYFEMEWYYFVLDYDLRSQVELLTELLSQVPDGGEELVVEGAQPSPRSTDALMKWVGAGLLLGGGLGAAVWAHRRHTRKREVYPALTGVQARRFLRARARLDRALAKRGLQRLPGETPMERAERAAVQLPTAVNLRTVESLYYAARYGTVHIDAAGVEVVEAALQSVRRSRPAQGS